VGAVWQTAGGGDRTYTITYDETDLVEYQHSKSVSRGQAISDLSRRAEMLVLTYVHSVGGIGDETYRAKMEDLRGN
jgi:hypothetical protein